MVTSFAVFSSGGGGGGASAAGVLAEVAAGEGAGLQQLQPLQPVRQLQEGEEEEITRTAKDQRSPYRSLDEMYQSLEQLPALVIGLLLLRENGGEGGDERGTFLE
uniref:Uncharacterized protein n=1 Tax=Pristionchus pacificus TaxID=54126 RepID=A0A2A6CGZ0_PRIPA|eukprot:PDM77495.1 hypothetical protein PRIPAC_34362 [Pristionchus pacificus]